MKSQEGSKPAERLNGSEILVRALAEEGVEYVFGYPGGSVLNIFDAIYKQDKFKHILVRHEQGAAHAADAYSRASNKVGVALVTSGPGATNAVTGIATAYADSIPMVIFTGQVNTLASGCFPRSGYRRYLSSLCQTQFLGERCKRLSQDD